MVMNGFFISSDPFELTINAAVIYMFYDIWIYIINGFECVFLWEDGQVPVCVGIMPMLR